MKNKQTNKPFAIKVKLVLMCFKLLTTSEKSGGGGGGHLSHVWV